MGSSPIIFFTLCCILSSSISPACSAAPHSLTPNQSLRDGQTLVSSNQRFELGFFSPGSRNSSNRYLGIWYKNIPLTIVWVANRNHPLSGFSGSLTMAFNGSLSLSNDTAQPAAVWSVSVTVTPSSPALRLLGNGNLVLVDGDGGASGDFMWQSFDYMTDNLLPEMKLGWNLKTGLIRNVTSWAADDDPSPGEYTFSLHPPEAPQLILTKGTQKLYRWGPWDGARFSGSPSLKPNTVFTPRFNTSREEIYYSFLVTDQSVLLRFVVTGQGMIQYLTWSGSSNAWVTMVALERDDCKYGTCGLYGVCYTEDPHCNCFKGFTPESPESWNVFDWTGGCTRKWRLDCEGGDGFVKYKDLKLPDNAHLITNMNLSLSFEECHERCLMNCSCMAFTRIDVHGNGGDCLMWYDDLIDLRDFPEEGDEIYIRMARAEIESIADAKMKKRQKTIITIVMPIVVGMLLFAVMGWYVIWKRRPNCRARSVKTPRENGEEETEDLELPLLSLATVSAATINFASENKIGEGGFGPVYKGVLTNGQEIAVKRLSQTSGQGIREFKNEVILIAKLQHRNLVKLLGCCIEREEKMLVYEYLPNNSLDCFLFDQTRKSSLTWKKHFDIVMGIARGLLYLHQDSRLRIIHRDLKASNVLLDIEMNPKISDFGIARTFGGEEQTEERTKRVIGTYGYMSPEYAMNGHFSTKSDVYSFGVIVLEIVSAQKNWGFCHPDHDLNLLGHAWKLWNEGKALELIDPSVEKSFDDNEVMRCIQVALLCVQQRAEDRPTMSSVVFMLGNESAAVAQPKEPGFVEASFKGMDTVSTGNNPFSSNELTFTTQDGR